MDEKKIQAERRHHEEKATMQRAAILGLQYLDTREIEQDLELAKGILELQTMYHNKMVPLIAGNSDHPTQFGVTSQTPQSSMAALKKEYEDDGKQAQFFLISQSGFRAFMRRFDPPREVRYDDIAISRDGDSDTIQKVSQTLATVGSEALFDFLITQADKLGASDIHIENEHDKIRIRMRVDGALHAVAEVSKDRYRVLMNELSRRANVSMASSDPQSGHMQQQIDAEGASHMLNIRVETVPTMYGQDAVLRLFNFDESLLSLDRLNITNDERARLDEIVSHPRGMVLMVGPTGSGKSTTLYSMLSALNTPDKKLITLEDPIEYGMTGISQIPIDTTNGKSFADGLRSVLRLDPDVVMIGEIRDADTARTAIQASITGHLVLSSFHASTASAAFSRMIDLIGQNPIFSSAIRLVIAQRLVRKLVDSTKEAYQPDDATKAWVKEKLEGVPQEKIPVDLETFTLYRPVPSDDAPFGYKGRIAIMEQLVVDESIQGFLRGDQKEFHTELVEKAARDNGMLTLEQNGIVAALKGETTLEEINRVI